MKVNVKLFAVAKQWADADTVELDLPAQAKIADLRESLLNHLPRLEKFGPHLRFAVNSEYADDETKIPTGAEIACIPPVSGG
jgi:molybdopterin synthase sulfur carrier subunit